MVHASANVRRINWWRLTWGVTIVVALVGVAPNESPGQNATIITSSGLGTRPIDPVGDVYGIQGGTRAEGNLFHSFGQFSVGAGHIAQFQTGSVPDATIGNILGRVTGGNPSNIFGTLDSATFYPAANLFLMNPAGIIFGPGATLNVGGMASFTTADYLKLGDGKLFYADTNPAADAILTSSPVAAFGFLHANSSEIVVQGSQLSVSPGQTLALVGGNVRIESGILPDESVQPANLTSAGGQMHIASAVSAGEFSATTLHPGPNIEGQTFTQLGSISVTQGSTLDVTGDSSGTIRIRGGQFVMDSSFLFAGSFGDVNGAASAVSIDAEEVSVTNFSVIYAPSFGLGRTGDIDIHAGNMAVTNGSIIAAQGLSGSDAGNITLAVDGHLSVAGDGSMLLTGGPGTGTGGAVLVQASSLSVTDNGLIRTEGGSETSGTIALNVTDLSLSTGGVIQTLGGDENPSGNINIRTAGSVVLDGNSDFSSRIISQNISTGGTGSITIEAGSLTLMNSAQILNETDSNPAGSLAPKLAIKADSVIISGGSRLDITTLHGDVGPMQIMAGTLTLSDQALIRSTTLSDGNSGNINIDANHMTLSGGSQINTSTEGTNIAGRGGDLTVTVDDTLALSGHFLDASGRVIPTAIQSGTQFGSLGDAGLVSVIAKTLDISDGALIASHSASGASGNAGMVSIVADTVTVRSGAIIASSTEGPGAGGVVDITGRTQLGSIFLDGTNSGIVTDTSGTGAGGNITTMSAQLQLSEGATISAKTSGQMPGAGNAGDILIKADNITISGGATITAESTGTGNAGTVTIQGTQSPAAALVITGPGSRVTSDTSNMGAGGNITIDATALSLLNGGSISAKTTGTNQGATGGTVTLTTNELQINNGTISASTTGPADAGTVSIVNGNLVALSNQGSVSSSTTAGGKAGEISITSPALTVDNASITTSTSGAGNAGSVTVNASSIDLTNGSALSSSSTETGSGAAGTVTLQRMAPCCPLPSVTVTDSTVSTSAAGTGAGGNIAIAAGDLTLTNATVSASVHDAPAGAPNTGGNVTLTSSIIDVTGGTITAATTGSRNAGTVTITGGSLAVTDGQVTTSTSGSGHAGAVALTSTADNLLLAGNTTVTSSTTVAGNAGQVVLTTPALQLNDPAVTIATSTSGSGNAGTVTLNTNQLELRNGAHVTSGSLASAANPAPSGSAGSVVVNGQAGTGTQTASVLVDGPGSGIFTDTQGTGAGGNITVNGTAVTVQNSAALSAATSGIAPSAAGGTITVNAGNVQMTSGGKMTASTTGAGAGGSINVNATDTVVMSGGSSLSANSAGGANAGNIDVTSPNGFTMQNSTIHTNVEPMPGGTAGGGDIKITTSPAATVLLQNSTISASVADGPGGGGNISIDPQFVILQSSQILAQADGGQGGSIMIVAGLFLPDGNSVVSADSGTGVDGNVNIQSPFSTTGSVARLGNKPLVTAALLNQRCAALAQSDVSSFIVAWRDTLPLEPGGWLTSPLASLSPDGGSTVRQDAPQTSRIDDDRVISLRRLPSAWTAARLLSDDTLAGCGS